MKPIPIALVGLGWVGTHRHLPILRSDPRFRLVGLIDQMPGRAAEAAGKLGLLHSPEAHILREVPWLNQVEAISIATSPWSHAPLVEEARELGLHVLTEKPFTVELDDAIALAEPGPQSFAVMHNFQFANSALRLWADMAAGRLGAIRSISANQMSNPRRRLPTWYQDLPLGLFYDESPHFFYLLRRAAPGLVLKNVDLVPGRDGATPELITARYAAPGPDGDIPVSLSMRFTSPLSEWYLAVQGEEALGIVDLFRDIYLHLPNDGLHTTKTVLRTSLIASLGHWGAHIGSGIGHLTGHLHYGVDQIFARFAEGIAAGRDGALIDRAAALDVVRMQHDIISAAGR